MVATAIAAIGLAVSAASAYGQYEAGQDQAAASQKAEAARNRQRMLQEAAERRKMLREAQAKAAVVRANTSAAGADAEGSSAVAGAMGQIGSNLGYNIGSLNSSSRIGSEVFAANAQASEAKGESDAWTSGGKIGSDIFNKSDKIASVGKSAGVFTA